MFTTVCSFLFIVILATPALYIILKCFVYETPHNIGGSKGVGGVVVIGNARPQVNFCQIHAIFRKMAKIIGLVLHLLIAPPVTEILDPPLINIGLENVHKTVWKFMLLFLCDIPDRFILNE